MAIIGGGVVGSALLYILSNYTSVKKIALIEKRGAVASMNSNSMSNSQTLHFGDVETNYTEKKAIETKNAAKLMLRYIKKHKDAQNAVKRCQKLLLAIGQDEIDYADVWFSSAKHIYKGLKQISSGEIDRLEPNILRHRDPFEKVSAYVSDTGYMVDFGKIADSFVNNSKSKSKKVKVILNARLDSVRDDDGGYMLYFGERRIKCRSAVFCAGAYGLYFARSLGMAGNLSVIPTGGAFFTSRKVLNGKVYRVQTGKIPFAAVHGDPDINNEHKTRFGPVIYLPLGLERDELQISDYARAAGFGPDFISAEVDILLKYKLTGMMLKHLSYQIPIVGKELFLNNEARKIVPSLKYEDLSLEPQYGGISPRVIDLHDKTLSIGEGKIIKDNLIFNLSPSPGASSCLSIAKSDAEHISKAVGEKFYSEKFNSDFRIGAD